MPQTAQPPSATAVTKRQPLLALLGVLLFIVVIWQLPYGRSLLYPFSLLATSVHELGHGLTAQLVGGQFDSFVLRPDGSGVALWSGSPGRLQRAAVAAGGLLGPSVVGSLLLVLARSPRLARWVAGALAAALVGVVMVWAGNFFTVAFLLLVMMAFAATAIWLADGGVTLVVRLSGALFCLSGLQDVHYLFAESAEVGGLRLSSDTAIIAEALWLPYWFWGLVIAGLSLAVLSLGLWLAVRPQKG